GVVLASADLDHVLGLLLLRELQSYDVWASQSAIEVLRDQNSMFRMLNRVPDQVRWKPIGAGESFVLGPQGSPICCQAIGLSSRVPAYSTDASESPEAVLGLVLTSHSGAKLGFFPQVGHITPELRAVFSKLDCLLLDGTFWSDDELIRLR